MVCGKCPSFECSITIATIFTSILNHGKLKVPWSKVLLANWKDSVTAIFVNFVVLWYLVGFDFITFEGFGFC
jgi:hypothetical protein